MNEKEKAFADLRIHYQTGRAFLISGSGRDKKYGYRNGIMTNLGDLERQDWIQRATALIEQYGETNLLEYLYQWSSEHNFTKESIKELHMRALQGHMARIFDDPGWVYYIPWNRRFRPEWLDESQLVWIQTGCCHEPGQITQEQLKNAFDNRVNCPCCGRFATYHLLAGESEGGHEPKIHKP